MMGAEAVFVDTNVLVYSTRPAAEQHLLARRAMQDLQSQGAQLWISPQVLREYLAVVTRPQLGAIAIPMALALTDVQRFIDLFNISEEGIGSLERLLDLLGTYDVGGKQIHDAYLVATMLEAGVRRLLTFNIGDFKRFGSLISIERPQTVGR